MAPKHRNGLTNCKKFCEGITTDYLAIVMTVTRHTLIKPILRISTPSSARGDHQSLRIPTPTPLLHRSAAPRRDPHIPHSISIDFCVTSSSALLEMERIISRAIIDFYIHRATKRISKQSVQHSMSSTRWNKYRLRLWIFFLELNAEIRDDNSSWRDKLSNSAATCISLRVDGRVAVCCHCLPGEETSTVRYAVSNLKSADPCSRMTV